MTGFGIIYLKCDGLCVSEIELTNAVEFSFSAKSFDELCTYIKN